MCGQITPTFNVQCLLGSYKQACIQKHRPVEPSAQRDMRVRIFLLSQLCFETRPHSAAKLCRVVLKAGFRVATSGVARKQSD